jgi:DNA-binding CsgD family transcriptional regulator
VVAILRDLVRQLGDSVDAGVLGPLASGLGLGPPVLGAHGDRYSTVPRIGDELAKTRLFESILACFTKLAERAPVVLMFEDLHWADSASAELLSFLTRNLAGDRVLLIGTYRSEEFGRDHRLRRWLSELSRQARVTRIVLDGLDRDEMATLIGGILGHRPDWPLVDAVWARSQGNALFAEELTASRHQPSLSAEFQTMIMMRVEGVSEKAQPVLQLVATAGAVADHDLLVAAGVLDTESLDSALAETVDGHVLVVDPGHAGYRFRHALLREAVYAALLPGERRRLHRQLATALAADASLGSAGSADRAAELAGHWWAAGAWAEALDASITAAESAIAVWAFPEALAHLERALSALDRLPVATVATAERLRLLEKSSDVAYCAGASQRAVDLAREAIERADVSIDASTVARYYVLLGRNAWAVGDSDVAFDAYRRAAALVPADPPSLALARILAEEARGLMLMSRFTEAERRCHDALAVADAVGARAEKGHILCTLGCCRGFRGYYDEGIDLVRQALTIALERADPDDLDRAYGNLGALLMESGRLEEAAALVSVSAAMSEELWGVRFSGATGNSVDALVRLGRHDEAEALLADTPDREMGSCAAAAPVLRAQIATRHGRFDEATGFLAVADELTVGLADVQLRGPFHLRSAELALLLGRPDDAYEHVERALALAAGTDDEMATPELCALAVRCLADRRDDARARGRRLDVDKARLLALDFEQEAHRLVAAPAGRGGTCTPRARAHASLCAAERSRLHESDPDLWEEAGRRWEAAGEPYPAAYCHWREAEALLERRAGRGRADECLQHAWRTSVDLGALPLRERIERLAQRARIPLLDLDHAATAERSTVAEDLGLTPREVEVLGQLAAGRTDREIASLLFISRKTVSVHVSNLLRKLDVGNRIEAGRLGQSHGLN